MATFLPAPLLGTLMLTLLSLNTLFWAIPVYLAIGVKLLTPDGTAARDRVSRAVAWFAQQWAGVNVWAVDRLLAPRWDLDIGPRVDPRGQYLVCSNHQSWNDILVLMKAFGRRAPFFKFFIKQQLIWVPVLGLAWWGLDYPFMKRYTPEEIARNPGLRGKDLETTRRACERFRNQPALVLNFLEGTRFTRSKHERQQSPYRNLLRPKAGGFAFALSILGGKLHSLLDVTIVYPDGARGFFDFLAGRVRRIMVEVREIALPGELQAGNYETDPVYRQRFQEWLASVWSAKDRRIDELRALAGTAL